MAAKVRKELELSREMEWSYAKDLRTLASSIRHPVLYALLYGISLDSDKHAMFYSALTRLLDEGSLLSEGELKMIANVIDSHIKVEESMIERTREYLKSVDDSRFKLIIGAVYSDEVAHHKLLLSIKKAIAEYAVVTEEDLWNSVWKDSPYHGAPAGD